MSDFGKRGRQSSPGRQSTPRAQRPDPVSPDVITQRDLKQIESGRLPAWATISRLKLVGFLALLPAIMLATIWFYGPEVVRDLRHAGTFTAAADLRATDGACKRYMFLVTMCSAKIRSSMGNEPERTSAFLMFFRSGDGEAMVPVRASNDPSVVGIHYATHDVLMNRTLSLLGVTMFFAWIWWLLFDCIRKGRYEGGPAHAAILQYMALRSHPA